MANEMIRKGDARVAVRVEVDSMFGDKKEQPVCLEVIGVWSEPGYRKEYLVKSQDGRKGVVSDAFLRILTKKID